MITKALMILLIRSNK